MTDVETIRLLYAYTDWANDELLAIAEQLPPARAREHVGTGVGSICATLAHTMSAEAIWLSRWQGADGCRCRTPTRSTCP